MFPGCCPALPQDHDDPFEDAAVRRKRSQGSWPDRRMSLQVNNKLAGLLHLLHTTLQHNCKTEIWIDVSGC
jgi:hypothetical protein